MRKISWTQKDHNSSIVFETQTSNMLQIESNVDTRVCGLSFLPTMKVLYTTSIGLLDPAPHRQWRTNSALSLSHLCYVDRGPEPTAHRPLDIQVLRAEVMDSVHPNSAVDLLVLAVGLPSAESLSPYNNQNRSFTSHPSPNPPRLDCHCTCHGDSLNGLDGILESVGV